MTGEVNLGELRRRIAPHLADGTYVYCCFPDFRLPDGVEPLCTFREQEGLTAIVPLAIATAAGLPHTFTSRLITLTVNSSLEAVGFLALVTERLAGAGIPCNAVAAYHHDHLFVPVDRADQAMNILNGLAGE